MDLPARIGRYEIETPLGQGGMGRVLLAHDTVLGRKVALKILRDDLGIGPEVKASLFERMRQEARAAAALSHPNMVTLHDMGEEDPVGLYLVFEYIDGPTLRDRIREGALPPMEVARLARQLGGALAHAHAAGVIHRDVKPENVMLAPTGAKITDFGIARLPDSTLTRVGSILGTPAYSAPEALASSDFGPASDQFSLAATLYEALSGTRAFPGDDALAVASRIANESPTPLSSFGSADAVLARALSKDKEKRYPSCEIFGEALALAIERRDPSLFPTPLMRLSREPISDTPPPRSSIVMRTTRRWQNIFAAVAVLVIVALVIVGRRQSALTGTSLKEVAEAFAQAAAPHSAATMPSTSTTTQSTALRPRPSAIPSSDASAAPSSSISSADAAAPAPSTSTSTSTSSATSTSTSTSTPTSTSTSTATATPTPTSTPSSSGR